MSLLDYDPPSTTPHGERMLELFSGTGRMAAAFKNKGWKTLTVDLHQEADLQADVRTLTREQITECLGGEPDFVWASPPCTAFSVASIGHHWTIDGKPKTEGARLGKELVERTLTILSWFPNARFCIENPRGMLRVLPVLKPYKRRTISFCQYGEKRMKPTDIWTTLDTWTPRRLCKPLDPCHDAAPRGSNLGTQGLKNAYDRGALPLALCEAIATAASIRRN